jgi:putative protease
MKITAPICRLEEAGPLIAAGADELYCGVYHSGWFPTGAGPNTKPLSRPNLGSFAELARLTAFARARGVPVYAAFNGSHHLASSRALALEDIAKALRAGASGIILADNALIRAFRRLHPGVPLIVSTMANCFNSEAVSFYRDLGVSRIVLPRDLSLPDLGRLRSELDKKRLKVPLEFFVQNLTCRNVDGLCRYHSLRLLKTSRFRDSVPGKVPCLLPYNAEFISRSGGRAGTDHGFRLGAARKKVCAACGMFHFRKLGIAYLKIVGRGLPAPVKIADVKFISALRDLLKKRRGGFEGFSGGAKKAYRRFYGRPCRPSECHFTSPRAARP